MPGTDVPIPREAVRAILIDGKGRTLLFKAFASRDRLRHFWITPGGGIAAGESDATALRRELAEECGLHRFDIGPMVWIRDVLFPHPETGQMLQQQERFYLVRIDSHEVDISGWDELERVFMTQPRWWTLDELAAAQESFAPRELPRHLGDLVRGHVPVEPIDVSG